MEFSSATLAGAPGCDITSERDPSHTAHPSSPGLLETAHQGWAWGLGPGVHAGGRRAPTLHPDTLPHVGEGIVLSLPALLPPGTDGRAARKSSTWRGPPHSLSVGTDRPPAGQTHRPVELETRGEQAAGRSGAVSGRAAPASRRRLSLPRRQRKSPGGTSAVLPGPRRPLVCSWKLKAVWPPLSAGGRLGSRLGTRQPQLRLSPTQWQTTAPHPLPPAGTWGGMRPQGQQGAAG